MEVIPAHSLCPGHVVLRGGVPRRVASLRGFTLGNQAVGVAGHVYRLSDTHYVGAEFDDGHRYAWREDEGVVLACPQ
jgi:hypothetical protein